MSHVLLRMPATAATVWDTDMVAKIRQRVAVHAAGREAEALVVLLVQTKIDGTPPKLARLAGIDPASWKPSLRVALDLLTTDREFNRLFHLIRSAL